VLIPSVPLVPVLFLSQALNAILLVPLLVVLNRLSGDRRLMGDYATGPVVRVLAWTATAVLMACVAALAFVTVT
jgi:Mn2+/Fe2+ NRAMP family transporter